MIHYKLEHLKIKLNVKIVININMLMELLVLIYNNGERINLYLFSKSF